MITSPDNQHLKTIRKLRDARWRRKLDLFTAEGEDLVEAAEAAGWEPEELLVAGEDVEPALLDEVSALGSGSRVVGIYRRRFSRARRGGLGLPARRPRPRQRRNGHPHRARAVRRPGDAGARLRRPVLAQGRAGQHGVAVRTAPGAGGLRGPAGTRVALDSRAEESLADVRLPAVLCLGGERAGLPEEVLHAADTRARIPVREDGPESLNVAAAAAIGLHRIAGHA